MAVLHVDQLIEVDQRVSLCLLCGVDLVALGLVESRFRCLSGAYGFDLSGQYLIVAENVEDQPVGEEGE